MNEAMNDVTLGYALNGETFEFSARVEAFRDLEHATRALQLHLISEILAIQPWVVTRTNVREEEQA